MVEADALAVVGEERGDGNHGFGVGGVLAMKEKEEGEQRNHASGGERVGLQPGLWCLPLEAWRNLREMKVDGAMR